MTTKTFILAGNEQQAREAAHSIGVHNPRDYVYASSTKALRGYSTWGQPRLITGTFYERPDAPEILDMLNMADTFGRRTTES